MRACALSLLGFLFSSSHFCKTSDEVENVSALVLWLGEACMRHLANVANALAVAGEEEEEVALGIF